MASYSGNLFISDSKHLHKDGVGAVCSRKTDRVFIATATGLQGVVSLQQSGRGIQKVEERNWPFGL